MDETNCKICSNKTKPLQPEPERIYHFCPRCDFISIDENSIPPPVMERERYLRHNNSPKNAGYVAMLSQFIRENVLHYKKSITSALDFGCGPEPVLSMLLKEQAINVDIYDLYFAPEKTYEQKNYDLITLFEVMEHLREPLQTLRLLAAHLNKNGILAISTLFHPENIEKFNTWWYRSDITHISFFTPRTFNHIADILSLKILKLDSKNTCVLKT